MAAEQVRLTNLEIRDWNQFGEVIVDFHPRLTVLTGANGSGKSTILRMVGGHMGWQYPQVAVPTSGMRGTFGRFLNGFFRRLKSNPATPQTEIARLVYSNGANAQLQAPLGSDNPTYQMQGNRQSIPGVYIPSHRPEFSYTHVPHLPARPATAREAFNQVNDALRNVSLGGGAPVGAVQAMKQTLVGWAVHSAKGERFVPDGQSERLIASFEDVLRTVLPRELGFERIEASAGSEVLLRTRTGNFSLESVSGGVAAILVIAWLLFTFSLEHKGGYTVVLDEPENHLHPKLQREILPSLLQAFPEATFVVATHSPLVIGSVRDKALYVLEFDQANTVSSVQLKEDEASGDASSILARVLGLESTLPPWVETAVRAALAESANEPDTLSALRRMRARLVEQGLSEFVPAKTVELLEQRQSK